MGNHFPRVAMIDKQQLDIMFVSSMENQALPVNIRELNISRIICLFSEKTYAVRCHEG